MKQEDGERQTKRAQGVPSCLNQSTQWRCLVTLASTTGIGIRAAYLGEAYAIGDEHVGQSCYETADEQSDEDEGD